MRQKLLLNDIHLGVQRASGTTPASAQQLQEYLLERFERILFEHPDKDVVINGDLFDSFSVSMLSILGFYGVARNWLLTTRVVDEMTAQYVGPKMDVGMGNHDWSKDDSKLSAYAFVCRLLAMEFPERFRAITKPAFLDSEKRIYMIPHIPNQDLFNIELDDTALTARIDGASRLLLLHANYHNGYAVESDHSLNVSEEQAKKLVAYGWTVVFGHEHQARTALNEGVIITGNQWPSSVADCLNNPGGKKHAHIIDENLDLEPILTWDAAADFKEIDWRQLDTSDNTTSFIRVVGKASAEEASHVIEAISRYRKDCTAYVVTNAVEIAGVQSMEDLPASVENVKAFDVFGFLLEHLESDRQRDVVRKLLADAPQQLKEAA
jgi:hypothetical protein